MDIIGENYNGELVDFSIEDDCYVEDNFIGTTVAKKITVNILNHNNSINLENKEISAFVGIGQEETEEIPFGNFIISNPPENDETEEKTNFVGYDYMIKFNKTFKDNNTYPISLKQYLTNLCTQVGIELGSTNLVNQNYMIQGNPFSNNEKCRTVLSSIAQLCGGFARIGRDNKLYIINLNSTEYVRGLTVGEVHQMTIGEMNNVLIKKLNETVGIPTADNIDGNTYMDFKKNNQYGGVNSLVLKLSQVEGEITLREDEESIEKNGLTEIVIEDNPFLTDSTEREKVIDELWENIKDLKYIPFKIEEYYGFPYLDAGDKVEIADMEDTIHISFVFNHKFIYNGSFKGSIETSALTRTQSTYSPEKTNIKNQIRNVELSVNKITGDITAISEVQEEQTTQISQISIDVSNVNIEVAKKVGKNEIKSSINTSPETIKIATKNLDLTGYATFNDLAGTGTTIINGSNITTGKISANRISGGTFTVGGNNNGNGIIDVRDSSNNTVVKINKDGIQMADGSKIIGGDGVYCNLQFFPPQQYGKIGYTVLNYEDIYQEMIKIYADIPSNFVIENAYITLRHQPITWVYYNSITATTTTATVGYARNVQIYVGELITRETIYVDSEGTLPTMMDGSKTNAMGNNGKTFSSTSIEVAKSSDLSAYLEARRTNCF